MLEIGLHLVLVARVGVDHVPEEHRFSVSLQQNVLNERTEDLVAAPEERADDGAGDEHDNRSLDDLGAVRPLDLLELAEDSRMNPPRRVSTVGHDGGAGAVEARARRPGAAGRATDWRGPWSPASPSARRASRRCLLVSPATPIPPLLPGLAMKRVRAAPTAIPTKLDPVGRVPLRLLGLVVAPLAVGAGKGDRDSDSGGHLFSFSLGVG